MIQFVLGLVVLGVILLALSIKILREYERAVIFRLGANDADCGLFAQPGILIGDFRELCSHAVTPSS